MNFIEKIKQKLKYMDKNPSPIKTVHYAPKNALMIPITLKNGRKTFKNESSNYKFEM